MLSITDFELLIFNGDKFNSLLFNRKIQEKIGLFSRDRFDL